jgi:hypothetical protein
MYKEITFNCSKMNKTNTTTTCCEANCPRYSSCDTVASVLDEEKMMNSEND